MHERFTDRARKVMQLANQEALRFRHEYIGTEHLLLGLIQEGSGVAATVLRNLGLNLIRVRVEVEKIVQPGPVETLSGMAGRPPQTPRAKKVIEFAIEEAKNLNHNYVGTEHLLLGLLREQEGLAAQVLIIFGLKLEDIRDEVRMLLGDNSEPPVTPDERVPVALLRSRVRELEREVKRLNEELALARLPEGIRAKVVEMDREIERLLQEKETEVAEQNFEWAAKLRDRADRLRKQRQALLSEAAIAGETAPLIVDNVPRTQPSEPPDQPDTASAK